MAPRAEMFQQKVVEAKEACRTAKGLIMKLRGSLGQLETERDTACSELYAAQWLIIDASSSLPSFPRLRGRVFCPRTP